MNTEAFKLVIENTKAELDRRPARKNIAMITIALLVFFGPVFFFFSQQSNVYQSAYAPLLVGWLMISVWIGHVSSSALLTARTTELALALEMATAILELIKEKEGNE